MKSVSTLIFMICLLSACDSTDYSHAYDATVLSADTNAENDQPRSMVQTAYADRPPVSLPADVPAGCEPAYDLGYRSAQRMLEQCGTASDIRNELLDLRAREYSIRTRLGADAADAYLIGIKAFLTERGDTLCRTLFD